MKNLSFSDVIYFILNLCKVYLKLRVTAKTKLITIKFEFAFYNNIGIYD